MENIIVKDTIGTLGIKLLAKVHQLVICIHRQNMSMFVLLKWLETLVGPCDDNNFHHPI